MFFRNQVVHSEPKSFAGWQQHRWDLPWWTIQRTLFDWLDTIQPPPPGPPPVFIHSTSRILMISFLSESFLGLVSRFQIRNLTHCSNALLWFEERTTFSVDQQYWFRDCSESLKSLHNIMAPPESKKENCGEKGLWGVNRRLVTSSPQSIYFEALVQRVGD